MDDDDYDFLCILSYLIKNTDERKIVGVSELAERLHYLDMLVDREKEQGNVLSGSYPNYVTKSKDESLDWHQLREFIDEIEDSQRAQLFVTMGPEELEPEEWTYMFYSRAPESVLEDQIDRIATRENLFKRLINKAATISEDELVTEVYSV